MISRRSTIFVVLMSSISLSAWAAVKSSGPTDVARYWNRKPHHAPPPPPSPPPPSPIPSPPPPSPIPTGPDVVSEGDSISVFWGGNHTGIYAASRPTLSFKGLAVGGSSLASLNTRISVVVDAKPKVFTVLVGANDMAGFATAQDFVTVLFSYAANVRATGAKVAIATLLPQQVPSQPANNALFNARRIEVNRLIRTGVDSGKIDAVIDFAADPVMGADAAASDITLYKDGIHPTDGCGMGCGGQGRLAAIYKAKVDSILAAIGR